MMAFVFCQIFLILIIKNKLLFVGSNFFVYDKSVYHGVLFISGELPNELSNSISTISSSFIKLSAILNNSEDYLFFVNGYFSSPKSPIPLINFMLNFLKELNVSAINLTVSVRAIGKNLPFSKSFVLELCLKGGDSVACNKSFVLFLRI
ncbi:MAG: hypothetical protein ACP5H3_03155 [Candidatus Aenigmatarchaeota archaeon]